MTDPVPRNLTDRTLRSIGWAYSGTVGVAMLQVGYLAIMGRLLTPRDFGLVAMAMIFERFGQYFARMGVGQALVQKPELGSDDVRVAFTVSILLGLLFTVLVLIAAPLAGQYFETDAVVPVVRALSVVMVVNSVSHVTLSLLQRRQRFRALAGVEMGATATAYLAVGVVLALLGFGVWSLVAAQLTQSFLMAVFSFITLRHRVLPLLRWKPLLSLYGYGSRISVVSFLEFVSSNIDTILIGRFAGAVNLGQYNRAFQVVNIPFERFVRSITRVLFPAFSKLQDESDRLRSGYRSAYGILGALLLPTAAGLGVAAPEVVRVALGPQWVEAARVLPLLAAAAAVNFLSHIGGVVADATAELNRKLALQVVHLAVITALLVGAARLNTLVAYAAAVLAAAIVRQLMYVYFMGRVLGFGLRDHARLLAPMVVSAGAVAGAIAFASAAVRPLLPVAGTLATQIGVGALSLGVFLWWGPLIGIRRELHQRLEFAGALSGNGLASRVGRRLLSHGR